MAQDLKTFIETNFKILQQCYKSQDALRKDLTIDIQRLTEICRFTSEANIKLDAEIKNGQQMLMSLSSSLSTIKTCNIELKKEYNDLKQTKYENKIRIQNGERKYENLWLACKERFESMEFVKQFNEAKNTAEGFKVKIGDLNLTISELRAKINSKRAEFTHLDRKRVVEIAKYMIEDRIRLETMIRAKQNDIRDLKRNIDLANKNKGSVKKNILFRHLKEENPLPSLNLDLEIPKLQLSLSDSQKEVIPYSPKIQEVPATSALSSITESFAAAYKMFFRHKMLDDMMENNNNSQNIIVLEDKQINNEEAMEYMSEINPEKSKIVEVIEINKVSQEITDEGIQDETDQPTPAYSQIIQENEDDDEVMIPPTQFRDSSQDLKESNESQKKKVTFDLPEDMDVVTVDEINHDDDVEMKQPDEVEDEMNINEEDTYNKIKELYLKKYNLDLSPNFVYAKKQDLRDVHYEKPITSKFFTKDDVVEKNIPEDVEENKMDLSGIPELKLVKQSEDEKKDDGIPDVDAPVEAGPNLQDSLNLTLNTTGLEESDIVPCIDSSLLLSPKGDLGTEEPEKPPLDRSRFLSGLRKNLSIFGNPDQSEEKPDSSEQPGSNFTFDFGGSKKSRGGLFNMFN